MFVVFVDAGKAGAIIDSLSVVSDGSYPAPHIVSIRGDASQLCGGVVIHYRVGIRHYTATRDMNLTVCWSKSRLAAWRQLQ